MQSYFFGEVGTFLGLPTFAVHVFVGTYCKHYLFLQLLHLTPLLPPSFDQLFKDFEGSWQHNIMFVVGFDMMHHITGVTGSGNAMLLVKYYTDILYCNAMAMPGLLILY